MEITVYTARVVRTMEPALPEATAIAVRDGRIVEVGDLETMGPWLARHPHRIDERFAEYTIMPGLIDPHLHPSMAAVLLPMHFITAVEWRLPWETVPATKTPEAFLERLSAIEKTLAPGEPLFTWGHHPIWHGEVTRTSLGSVSKKRPIVVWHRGFHSLVVNDAAIAWMKLDEENAAQHPHVDLPAGRFFETGLGLAFRHLNPYLLEPERFRYGLGRLKEVVHLGGHTTIGDMAAGMFDLRLEWDALVEVMERDDTPFRVDMVPYGLLLGGPKLDEEHIGRLLDLSSRNTHRLRFGKHVKLFSDGGFYAELMQLGEPGFIDSDHSGEWMMPPDLFREIARLYWQAGLQIHVHTTGDLGLELVLDTLQTLQDERPRFDHRFTIEHMGISTPEQVRKMSALGALASVNVYYVHELGDAFWKNVVGHERASQMARLGTLARFGVPTAIHSDYTMAPALPLHNAWVAANRVTEAGSVMGAEERLTLEQALRTITVDAAFVLGREHEIGSLRAGKIADFTVLDADPFEVGAEKLNEISVLATVFEGEPFPVPS